MASTYLMCFICGRKFGSSSLLIHQKTCRSTFLAHQEKIPPEYRKELPETPQPPKRVTRKTAERFNEQIYDIYKKCLMHSCSGCNRAFSDFTKLIAHRSRCERLKWSNNPAAARNGVDPKNSAGVVLSWKSRNKQTKSKQPEQELSSSFDDSDLSSSPSAAAEINSINAVGRIGWKKRVHNNLGPEKSYHRQSPQTASASLKLSHSGNILFREALSNQVLDDVSIGSSPKSPSPNDMLVDAPDIPAPDADDSPTKRPPQLPGSVIYSADGLSKMNLEARRKYHHERLKKKLKKVAVPNVRSLSTPDQSSSNISLSEDSPEAQATIMRLKAMYMKRKSKLLRASE